MIGIKKLSREQIELKAEEIIDQWFPQVGQSPMPFPLIALGAKLEDYGIKIQYNADLEFSSTGQRILGCFSLDPRVIYIDYSLKGDPRFAFVLAHEIGHLILHRNIDFQEEYESFLEAADNISDNRTDRDWIEWQANTFASCLLLPRKNFHIGLRAAQKYIGINRTGKIYVVNDKWSKQDLHKTMETLASIYNVPKTIIYYRLKALNLIDEPEITYDSRRKIKALPFEED